MKFKQKLLFSCSLLLSLGAQAQDSRTPISACQAITSEGSYVLTSNLAASGNCIEVSANNVTLDLNGYTISGNGTGAAVTDSGSTSGHNLAVRNGVVRNFESGLILVGAGVVIDRLTTVDNANSGVVSFSGARITASTAAHNGNNGFYLGAHSIVTGSTVTHNAVGINAAQASTISGNVVGSNTNHGIIVQIGSTVSNNTIRGPGGFGIYLNCPSIANGNISTAHGTNLQLAGSGCLSTGNLTQ